jgi:hypothetical protein
LTDSSKHIDGKGSPKLAQDETRISPGVIRIAAQFVRKYCWRSILLSAGVLVPCFWHRRIVAADLGSHLYNAWLVHLIRRGDVPGLWLAHRWNNVLFDFLLEFLSRFFSWPATERIAVSMCVLIFFWGMFVLAAAANRRAPWNLIPAMAMFAYGYTFHMGFFNYYLAIGLSFWGIAIAWRGSARETLMLLAIAPLAMLAHPLGLFWLIGGAVYVVVAQRIPRWPQLALAAGSIALLAAVHIYLGRHNVVEMQERPFYYFWGGDQLLLFGKRYAFVTGAFLVFAVTAIALDLRGDSNAPRHRGRYAIALQLYVVLIAGVILLPEGVRFANQSPALALLTERLTSVSAAVLCCLLAAARPKKWHLAAMMAIAAVFFAFVYQDTGRANRMEARLERLVRTIPPGQRVMGTITPFPGSRILIQHMLDRACIGYCFSYGNYEAASGLFRVRATPGNPYVLTDFNSTADMEDGTYEVQDEDLPAYQVNRCSESSDELCIRPLAADGVNDPAAAAPNP